MLYLIPQRGERSQVQPLSIDELRSTAEALKRANTKLPDRLVRRLKTVHDQKSSDELYLGTKNFRDLGKLKVLFASDRFKNDGSVFGAAMKRFHHAFGESQGQRLSCRLVDATPIITHPHFGIDKVGPGSIMTEAPHALPTKHWEAHYSSVFGFHSGFELLSVQLEAFAVDLSTSQWEVLWSRLNTDVLHDAPRTSVLSLLTEIAQSS